MGLSVAKEKLYEPIPAFIELYNSPVGQYLKKFDKSITLEPRVQFVAAHLINHLEETNPYDKTIVFGPKSQEMMFSHVKHSINTYCDVC